MYGQRGKRRGSSESSGPSWSAYSSESEIITSESKDDSDDEVVGIRGRVIVVSNVLLEALEVSSDTESSDVINAGISANSSCSSSV